MKLNDAKNILIGDRQVEKVYLGEQLIWPQNVPIPTDGLTDYFDCRIGLSLSSWKNQAGGNDIVFFGDPEIMEDGSLGLRDSAKDYGSLLSPYTENRTFYCIFKTEVFPAINDNVYILGASDADDASKVEGLWMTLCSNGYPDTKNIMGISIDRFYVYYRSQILSDIYHTAAVRISRQNDGQYKTELFIDGQYSDEIISSYSYSDLIGIGTILYHDGTTGAHQNKLKQIRALAIYSAAHSDEEILEHSREISEGHPSHDLFCLEISDIRGSGSYMQLSEFSLYDANRQKIQISEWSCTCSNMSDDAAESADNLIDGDPDTKMCVSYSGGVCTVQMYLVLPEGIKPSFYSITTGNDSPERDPVSWNLYHSAGFSELALVDSQTNANVPEERKTESELFPINTGGSE